MIDMENMFDLGTSAQVSTTGRESDHRGAGVRVSQCLSPMMQLGPSFVCQLPGAPHYVGRLHTLYSCGELLSSPSFTFTTPEASQSMRGYGRYVTDSLHTYLEVHTCSTPLKSIKQG
jgi:hypothetical protein